MSTQGATGTGNFLPEAPRTPVVTPKSVPAVQLVRGGVGTGKTQHLVERAAQAAGTGESALVLCATPDAARAFSRRLTQRLGCVQGSLPVEVLTPRELALEVLSQPAAHVCTGRLPRLLTPIETDFLLEDLKVSGVAPKRLRELLRFLERSITELAHEDPSFIVDVDEEDVLALYNDALGFTRGVTVYELGGLALRALRGEETLRPAFTWDTVLVDDYQLLCRASQLLACEVAGRQLVAAGDPFGCYEAFEPYPYAPGMDELLAANPAAHVVELVQRAGSSAVTGAVSALRSDKALCAGALAPCDGAPDGTLEAQGAKSPSEEITLVVRAVEGALANGATPDEIAVAVPNGLWARNVAAALGARGIACVRPGEPRIACGDVHALERCEAARALTLVLLAGDPLDAVAWRSWLGFGDYLTLSNAVDALRKASDGCSLTTMLARLEAGQECPGLSDKGRERVIAAYRVGRAAVERLANLEGDALLSAATALVCGEAAEVPVALRKLCAPFADGSLPGDDARSLRERALQRMFFPVFDAAGPAVCIAPLEGLAGQSFKTLVASGFVNGFSPSYALFDPVRTTPAKERPARAKELVRVACGVGKAYECAVFTHFSQVTPDQAGRLKLKVVRVGMANGVPVAYVGASDFLKVMGLA